MKKNLNKLPKISVIIPSFNKKDYIGDTLQSIFNQDYPRLEVIIQDGGSTDGSLDILKDYSQKYKEFIVLESQKDGGQTDAINKGFKKATGDILGFVNADDLLKPNALFKLAEAYRSHPEALWFTGFGDIINEEGELISGVVTQYKNSLIKLNKRFFLLCVNYLTQPATFIRKEAYVRFGDFSGVGKIVMEYEYWLKLSRVTMPVVIPDYFASFRLAQDNFSVKNVNTILSYDMKLVRKESINPVIIFIHWLNNLARIALITLHK